MKSLKALFLSCAIMMTMGVGTMAYAQFTDETLIEFYVDEFKVSRDEAIRRLDMMANSRPLINELEDKYKENIAGIFFDNGKEFKLVVRTTAKGKDLKELRALAGSQNKIPVLIIKNAPRNAKAIANIVKNQSQRLVKKIDGLAMIGYDEINDKIVISIYEPDINKQNAIKNDKSLQKLSGIETQIEFLSAPLDVQNLKGGAPIHQNVKISENLTTLNNCTSAFPAIYNGKEGLLTASHCADKTLKEKTDVVYKGYGNDVRTEMMVSFYDKNASHHDIMFIEPKKSTKVDNLFYISPTKKEVVNNYVKPISGSVSCKYGQVTGNSCGRIAQINVMNVTDTNAGCPSELNFGIKCDPTFVAMRGEKLKVANGDSGGAVYVVEENNQKYPVGVLSSGLVNNLGGIVVFSPLTHLDGMGIKLKTK